MPSEPMLVLTVAAAVAIGGAALILWVLLRRGGPLHRDARTGAPPDDPAILLFEGGTLLDATPAAWRLLDVAPGEVTELEQLQMRLAPLFPALGSALSSAPETGRMWVEGVRDGAGIAVETWDGMTRLTLTLPEEAAATGLIGLRALEDEVTTLRLLAEAAPAPIWCEDGAGTVTWANAAYLRLTERHAPATAAHWPPPNLFASAPVADGTVSDRESLQGADGQSHWFELTTVAMADSVARFATPIDRLVAAEAAGRSFVQTLAKTFAQLSTGLAIFDRDRRLVMFNPALLDLTGLPASFLSARPAIGTFLDRLRDRNMLPEPKNYKSWRQQVSALEAAAAEGTYSETWTLPGGQTYRVIGRPHPDGAIAFLFEDISAEISLTRAFRSELETAQAVLDSLPEAMAVFSPAGTLMMSNEAYADHWGGSAADLGEASLRDEIGLWQNRCAPSPALSALHDAVARIQDRKAWDGSLRLLDGRAVTARFRPLNGGASLVTFAVAEGTETLRSAPVPAGAGAGAETDPGTELRATP